MNTQTQQRFFYPNMGLSEKIRTLEGLNILLNSISLDSEVSIEIKFLNHPDCGYYEGVRDITVDSLFRMLERLNDMSEQEGLIGYVVIVMEICPDNLILVFNLDGK